MITKDIFGMHLIVYLHGFKSSPNSHKARLTHQAVQALQEAGKESANQAGKEIKWYCPQLPPSPCEAMQMVREYIDQQRFDQVSFIGSSLGGYYATYLAERYPSRVTLLNPAIFPARDLEKYIGEQKSWHNEDTFYFKPEYIQELQELFVPSLTHPERYFLIAAKGDEVLDWQEMCQKYPGAQQLILEGSDHAISEYAHYIEQIMQFHFGKSLTQRKPT